ncbi:MAG TPA: hypothetical protein VFS89_08410 [Nitrosospira sp.]|nr:hypothetical protein [Nitrosospira sp.]
MFLAPKIPRRNWHRLAPSLHSIEPSELFSLGIEAERSHGRVARADISGGFADLK